MNILVINAGSSSVKFQLLDFSNPQAPVVLAKGGMDRLESHESAARAIFESCANKSVNAIGYRVVHGGDRFVKPVRITPDVLNQIAALAELAPLHNQPAVACMREGLRVFPNVPAIAVFDTSFHRTMPDVAQRYAIPRPLADQHHLYRFGFHGISHQYVSSQLLRCMGRLATENSRLITCHLGNGASICAIRDGKSIDTSMGLTPLEGLVMGTRSGDIDAGLVLHLMRRLKMSADDVDELLNHRSGLLGLSGRSGDVRDLESAANAGNTDAVSALEAFAYRCRKYIGAYAAALGGVDGIGFAGGVGEHSPNMRSRIAAGLDFLGIHLDESRNTAAVGKEPASIGSGPVQIWVIPTNEERQVAREVFGLCFE